MKYFKLNNRFLLFFTVLLMVGISSCEKVKEDAPLGDKGPKYIGFMDVGGPEGFKKANVAFSDPGAAAAAVEVRLLYTGPQVFDNDVTVTIAVDAAAVATYNAAVPPGELTFLVAPTASYSFPTTTALIKKGNTMSEPFTIDFKPNMLNPALSYMLPLTISGVAGAPADVVKAPGTGTALLHVIGNVLAGKYTWRYRRWQSGDTTTAPLQDLVNTTNLSPLSASKLLTRCTYVESFIDGGGGIILNFTETGGVLSNFSLSYPATTTAGITGGGFTLAVAPKFTGTGINVVGTTASNFVGTQFGTYHQFINSTGGVRSLVNSFTKIP
jgi:hypothetical protein